MTDLHAHTEDFIRQFRESLPVLSATAQSIDRNDSWLSIAVQALNEGYLAFANQLVDAYEALLRQLEWQTID